MPMKKNTWCLVLTRLQLCQWCIWSLRRNCFVVLLLHWKKDKKRCYERFCQWNGNLLALTAQIFNKWLLEMSYRLHCMKLEYGIWKSDFEKDLKCGNMDHFLWNSSFNVSDFLLGIRVQYDASFLYDAISEKILNSVLKENYVSKIRVWGLFLNSYQKFLIYRKILNISPGLINICKHFWGGSYSGGLIFGGHFVLVSSCQDL